MNPYEVLNVGPEARREEIIASYRRLARKHHPDAGGNVDDFKQLSEAYKILSDPRCRKRYDETGDCEPWSGNHVVSELRQFFCGILLEILDSGRDPEVIDLIGLVRLKIYKEKMEQCKMAQQSRSRAKKLCSVVDRIETKNGNNLLAQFLRAPIAELKRAAAVMEDRVQMLDECKSLLDEYKYRFDKSESKVNTPAGQWEFIRTNTGS